MPPPKSKWLAVPLRLQPPTINLQVEDLGLLSRSAECLRHYALSIEFWLSPRGRLRWWLKLNVLVAVWLIIPAVLLAPIIGFLLHTLDAWLSILLSIGFKVVLLAILVALARKHFPSSFQGSSRKQR